MIVGEPKCSLIRRGGGSNFGEDSGGCRTWKFCNFAFRGWVSSIFLVSDLHVIVSRVNVLVNLMFYWRYITLITLLSNLPKRPVADPGFTNGRRKDEAPQAPRESGEGATPLQQFFSI